jgi:formate dehydrogenase major subunit
MGSNMAENHPVGFQWPMEAKRRGTKLIHIDPHFSRTSALADVFVPIRAGTDIVFLGAVINYILEHERYFEEYVKAYTNAATIISEDFRDTEDQPDDSGAAHSGEAGSRAGSKPEGLFSGWDEEKHKYDVASWQYEGMPTQPAAGEIDPASEGGEQAHGAHGAALKGGEPPHEDPTLEHPRCVFQLLRRHYSRYTPELVERVCGVPRARFLEVAQALCENSGRERTSAIVYAVGWTQHSIGVQYIRAASIIQLLLGNIGRPGGGIMALRGHASIQGSTDIPTLYNILPGYLPMPHPLERSSLEQWVEATAPATGYWGHADAYFTSLLKAWWGEHATAENDYCFDYVPRITGDHSHYTTVKDMLEGKLDGYFVMGENPAVGSANSRMQRLGLSKLKWLVVRDFVEIETAAFWRESAEIEAGELRPQDIATEVFLMPAAAHTEKDGTFTNTQRLLQWHQKAIEPPGDARSELWFMFHLGRRVREKLAGSTDPKDRPILELVWDYPTEGPTEDPSAAAVLQEINGFDADGKPLSGYTQLKSDGSTSCGCWIYCGCYADGVNQTARRKPGSEQSWVAPEWAWAWPMNRRIIYNRASADPDGKPWSERKRYIWWDAEQGKWTGHDVPDFKETMPPDYVPPEGAAAEDGLRGDEPFVMQADGRGWLYAPAGLVDGPLPTHYEPPESPFPNALYRRDVNPALQRIVSAENPHHPAHGEPGTEVYPYVVGTYRLTEHHTAGGMSRTLPYLAELQPEFFCEVSPELAGERGLEHAGWATIITARSAIEARVLVTERMRPLTVHGRTVHQIGLPYHWGPIGYSKGDSANDLLGLELDPNVHIGEYKASTCDIRPGRRPRGPALRELVLEHRARAGITPR